MRDEYDFSKAKRASEVPHLAKLQEVPAGKTRITIMLDNDVLDTFRERAAAAGKGYQTAINEALRDAIQPVADPMTLDVMRAVALEEFTKMLPVAFARVRKSVLLPAARRSPGTGRTAPAAPAKKAAAAPDKKLPRKGPQR